MRPRIQVAGAGSVGDLVRLNARLFREDAGTRDRHTDVSWPEKHGRDHFLGLLCRDDAACFLALADQEAVGYLAGYVRNRSQLRPVRVAELQSIYVLPAARGGGVGAQLVDEFLAWARYLGADQVGVTAYAANERAIRFYERMGFEPREVSLELGL